MSFATTGGVPGTNSKTGFSKNLTPVYVGSDVGSTEPGATELFTLKPTYWLTFREAFTGPVTSTLISGPASSVASIFSMEDGYPI